uniref:Pi068 protein n=1 Tax=Schizosaccharomyces pombe TaxID=4896 RepID=O13659_SCHPM|nr:pi068 [Schizosaccharomyces pombe]
MDAGCEDPQSCLVSYTHLNLDKAISISTHTTNSVTNGSIEEVYYGVHKTKKSIHPRKEGTNKFGFIYLHELNVNMRETFSFYLMNEHPNQHN